MEQGDLERYQPVFGYVFGLLGQLVQFAEKLLALQRLTEIATGRPQKVQILHSNLTSVQNRLGRITLVVSASKHSAAIYQTLSLVVIAREAGDYIVATSQYHPGPCQVHE